MLASGFSGGSDSKESACNAGDPGFDPWVGKIPWRRAWQPTPVFLPVESPWTEVPGRLQSMGSQRVRHDWAQTAQRSQLTTCGYIWLYSGHVTPRRNKENEHMLGHEGVWELLCLAGSDGIIWPLVEMTTYIYSRLGRGINRQDRGTRDLCLHPYLFTELACSRHNKHDDVADSHGQQPSCLQYRLHVGRSLKEMTQSESQLRRQAQSRRSRLTQWRP